MIGRSMVDEETDKPVNASFASILLLDSPEGLLMGLDYCQWKITKRFMGISNIERGAHFLYWDDSPIPSTSGGIPSTSAPNSEKSYSDLLEVDKYNDGRCGCFIYLNEGEVLTWRWDKITSAFHPLSEQEHLAYADGVKHGDFLGNLAPIQDQFKRPWTELTFFITPSLVNQLEPVKKIIHSETATQHKGTKRPHSSSHQTPKNNYTPTSPITSYKSSTEIHPHSTYPYEPLVATSDSPVQENLGSLDHVPSIHTFKNEPESKSDLSSLKNNFSIPQQIPVVATNGSSSYALSNTFTITPSEMEIQHNITQQHVNSVEKDVEMHTSEEQASSSLMEDTSEEFNANDGNLTVGHASMKMDKAFNNNKTCNSPKRPDQKDGRPESAPSLPYGSSLFYSEIPKNPRLPSNATAREISNLEMDTSTRLNLLLHKSHQNDHTYFLGELQFAYIVFLLGYNYDSFNHWKQLLILISNAQSAVATRPGLFVGLFEVILKQLEQAPDELFSDELLADNFLLHCIINLIEIIDYPNCPTKALTEVATQFVNFIQTKFEIDVEQLFTLSSEGPTIC